MYYQSFDMRFRAGLDCVKPASRGTLKGLEVSQMWVWLRIRSVVTCWRPQLGPDSRRGRSVSAHTARSLPPDGSGLRVRSVGTLGVLTEARATTPSVGVCGCQRPRRETETPPARSEYQAALTCRKAWRWCACRAYLWGSPKLLAFSTQPTLDEGSRGVNKFLARKRTPPLLPVFVEKAGGAAGVSRVC